MPRKSSDDSSSDTSSHSDGGAERKKKRSKKQKKDKKSKKHKRSKEDKNELVRQARAFLEAQLQATGGAGTSGLTAAQAVRALPPVQVPEVKDKISADDYFARHAEFATFLLEERRIQFGDLSSEKARELFEEFVRIWNEGRLAPRYYGGLVAAPLRRTEYRWTLGAAAGGAGAAASGAGSRGRGMAAFMEDQSAGKQSARQDARRQDKARARELLEDVAPREAAGRDRAMAERAARRELAKSRDDDGPGGFVPGGGDLLGGDDSFAAAKARESRRAETTRQRGLVRAEEFAQKAAAYQAKEDEKLAGLRALLSKGPISIAKR